MLVMKKRTKEDKTRTHHIFAKKVTIDYTKLSFLEIKKERRRCR